MPGIAAIANTFNSPNYVGELFGLTPTDTPFLSAIGGLTGGKRANGIVHTWSVYDLRAPDPNRQRLEGADAPGAETRVRGQDRNVLEIHQETVGVTYTRQSAQQMFASTGSAHPNAQALGGSNAVAVEMDWQTRQALVQIARDVELGFLVGKFQEPSDNSTVRKTRGIIDATKTNVITNAQPKPLTEAMAIDLLQKVWENGGIQISETATIMCNAWQKRQLTNEFITKKNYREETRNIGGVAMDTIITVFGRLNIMLNRYMPADTVQVVTSTSAPPCCSKSPVRASCSPNRSPRPAPPTKPRSTARSASNTDQRSPTARSPASPPARSCPDRKEQRREVRQPRHPQLVVHDLAVAFVDGEAEVTDKDTIEALRRLPAELGVRSTGGRPPKDPTQS